MSENNSSQFDNESLVIINMHPSKDWYVVYENDDGSTFYSPIAGWALVSIGHSRSAKIVGFAAGDYGVDLLPLDAQYWHPEQDTPKYTPQDKHEEARAMAQEQPGDVNTHGPQDYISQDELPF